MLESGVPSQDFIRKAAETKKGWRTKRGLQEKWEIPDSDMNAVLSWLLMTAETYPGIGPDSDGLLNFCDSSSSKDVATDPAEAGAAATAAAGAAAAATPSAGKGDFAVMCLHVDSNSVNYMWYAFGFSVLMMIRRSGSNLLSQQVDVSSFLSSHLPVCIPRTWPRLCCNLRCSYD